MDLRSIINVDGDGAAAAAAAPRQASATPVTPVQPGPHPQSFRDYHAHSHPQASPSNQHRSIDYGTTTPSPQASLGNHGHGPPQYYGQPQPQPQSQVQSGPPHHQPFTSPISYHQRPPPPPPIQAQHEFRSPAGSYSTGAAQSPYRQTPTSSLSNSHHYPFPVNPNPPSPATHQQQYHSPLQHHNPHPQSFPTPVSIPQTPPGPVGIPGSVHPYLQRSQSSLSVSTPTSAHSQPPYFNQPSTPNVPVPESHRSSSTREQSLSVSPKTQPTKRKLGESEDMHSNGHARKISVPYTNGHNIKSEMASPMMENRISSSANRSINGNTPPPKRRRYSHKPIWAQSWKTVQPAVQVWNDAPPRPVDIPIKAEIHTPQPMAPSGSLNVSGPHVPTVAPVHTITGVIPQDGLSKAVADFLFIHVVNRRDWGELDSWRKQRGLVIEIEAKLGHIIDKETRERYYMPKIGSACILQDPRMGFESNMTQQQHQKLNMLLNAQVRNTAPLNPERGNRAEIKYEHIFQVDKFYELNKLATAQFLPPVLLQTHNPNHSLKVRITHDKNDGRILKSIIKGRIQDLMIFNPTGAFDCRISINYEIDYDGGMDQLQAGDPQPDRNKDRLSYTLGHYQIDLTKVETEKNGVQHTAQELEIEVSTDALREHGSRALNGQPNDYPKIVDELMSNIWILTNSAI